VGVRGKALQWTKGGETDAEEIGKATKKANNKQKTTGKKQAKTKQKQLQENKSNYKEKENNATLEEQKPIVWF
jgi:hypothetical protein